MNILYLGRSEGTSRHRAEALKRLGHRVRLIDLKALLIGNRAIDFYIYKFGGRFLNTIVRRAILGLTAHDSHDLVWVDGGELVDSELVGSLRRRFGRTINYNIDDPFGSRDGDRWTIYQRCIPFYDLVVVMREINVQEAYRLGAKHVMRVFMSADEIAHRPHSLTAEDVEKDRSDVLFVGTWLPERGPIIGDLIKAGIPISIYGDRWHHAKEWKNIRPFWKGPGIFSDGYSKLIQSAKICLGLLSKGNRDLHTTRSFEIPSLGSVLLAERTKEHESLFRDGQEAVFWSNIDECIDRCNWLLNDEVTRNSIAIAGQARCTSSGYYNEVYLKKIIGQISGGVPILNARNYAQLKRNLKILYIGINEGTSSHRAKALMRLGHQVRIVDPIASFNKTLADTWTFKTGGLVLRDIVMRQIAELVSNDHYDLVWVNGGALIKPALVRELRKRSKRVINYNNDDPFGERDGDRWQTYLEAVPEYDLLAVVREPNVMEARQKGAKNVIRVFMSADEVIHAPRRISNVELDKWKSDVVFVGTWLPERGPFLLELADYGVPLSIYGDRWKKAAEWPRLKRFWRGHGLFEADDYSTVLQCAKICICLLSRGNRDLHTRRSVEIPYLGSLLMAERTSEHVAMYRENEEAAFWSTAEECAEKCKLLLSNEALRTKISAAGRLRSVANGFTNERIVETILAKLCLEETLM